MKFILDLSVYRESVESSTDVVRATSRSKEGSWGSRFKNLRIRDAKELC